MARRKNRRSNKDIVLYYGKHIRRGYSRLLRMADDDGVKFQLNSAYRSVAKQWQLWWAYKRGQGPLAAFPGTSTHNKRTWKQGLDINDDGGRARFQAWAAKHGMKFDLTVPGEGWHVNARANYDKKINAMWKRRHG